MISTLKNVFVDYTTSLAQTAKQRKSETSFALFIHMYQMSVGPSVEWS